MPRHLSLLLLATVLLAGASAPAGPPESLLVEQPDGPALRARLIACADSLAARDPAAAGQALAWAGMSLARTGKADSAIAIYERALTLDAGLERRVELAAALLLRLRPGDAARARDVLRPIQPGQPQAPDPFEAPQQGLLAWAHFLAGGSDSAVSLFAPVERWLSVEREWRYRLACMAFEASDWRRVITLLVPLAVASRTHDTDVMEMLRTAAQELNIERQLPTLVLQEIGARDRGEQVLLKELGARRVSFTGRDRFPLGGVLLTPTRAGRPRAAVVLMAPHDTLALYDTLAVGLRRSGFAVLLLEARGSGRSVAPGCPLPESWRGREAQVEAQVAGDVRAAVAALAREARADTAQVLVVGVGSTAPIAVRAAQLDRRVRVLLLVGPTPAPVERGSMRAGLAALQRPVYFQTGPEESSTWGLIDMLYGACDPRASRVADSDRPGVGATLFRRDPRTLVRFNQWLAESWPRPPARRATPPAPRRSG